MGKANIKSQLTEKQRIFAEEYLKSANATQAYKKAYSSCKKDSTARTNGARLLAKAHVREYIDQVNEKIHNANIMSIQEIKETYTKIARSEAVDEMVRVKAMDSLVKVSTVTEAEARKLEIEQAKLQLERDKLEQQSKQGQGAAKDVKIILTGPLEKWGE